MGEVRLDERCLSGRPEVEDEELRPHCAGGVVTMETRRVEEEKPTKKKKEEEEERWRKLFPEIKRCVILIPRNTLEVMKVKQEEEEEGGGVRSADPEPHFDWMEPLEPGGGGGGGRFVKKVEFKVQANLRLSDMPRRPLKQSSDVITADPAHRLQQHGTENKHTTENNEEEDDEHITPSETDHNYTRLTHTPDNNSQSQEPR